MNAAMASYGGAARSSYQTYIPAAAMVTSGSKKRPDSGLEYGVGGGGKEAKQHHEHLHRQSNPAELVGSESEETELSTSEGEDSSWISWFCCLRGNELLCKVDEDYIRDDFNLCGLRGQVPHYDHALDMILDNDSSFNGEINGAELVEVEHAAELLYGLIHARFILTVRGLNAMQAKHKNADFGRCPRVYCTGQPCLPVGISDTPRHGLVKIFCPKCEDLYFPKCKYQSDMDGAYVGTTFPHLFLMTFPLNKPAKPAQSHIPRVFGFKLRRQSR